MSALFGLTIAGKLLAVVVLVFANGFFVAAEFALVSLRRSRVEQLVAEGHPLAKPLQRAVNKLDTYLAATQLGITMSSLGLGWLGEPAIAALIEPVFHSFLPEGLALIGSHTLAVIIAFTIITALHIVLGELAPKSLALQQTERTALSVVRPLEFYLNLFRPAISFLNGLGNLVLGFVGLRPGSGEESLHSPAEIQLLVDASSKAGLVGETEHDMVDRVFHLANQRVYAVMTPRTEIVWLDLEDSSQQIHHKVTESAHSHFPVCQDSIDNLLGVVQAKELLAQTLVDQPVDLKTFLRQPLYVPEITSVLKVLELFKRSVTHIAFIVDEYGVIQGLVTLNDILEAIVGDIPSPEDLAEPEAVQREDGSWLLDGMLPLDEFQKLFQIPRLSAAEGANYHTLGGFMMMHLGRIPAAADQFEWSGLRFEVMDMDGNRVDKVLVIPASTDASKLEHDSHG
jgi:CBS domain containing-hemolysin-like protein